MKKANSFIIMVVLISFYPLFTTISWKNPAVHSRKYNKILVLSLPDTSNSSLPGKIEEYLIDNLNKIGYTPVSAISKYGPKSFANIREEETIKQLYPYDAVITVVLLNKLKDKHCRSVSDSNNFFWDYYSDMHDRVRTPGYYTSKAKYYWEINFYGLNNWQLLYSMQTQSFNPVFTKYLAKEYGKLVVTDMVKNNILQRQNTILKPF